MMNPLDRPSTPCPSLSTPDAVQSRGRRAHPPRPEPTVLTQELRTPKGSPELSRWVDRRGDLLPVKRGPTWYTPRFGLSDWDRVPVGSRRQAT